MDTGSTAFMLVATALVMLMTPGLAFFYGGLVGRKNALTIMMQSFISMAWTTVLWVTFGFSMCFGNDVGGIVGDGKYLFLSNISTTTAFNDQIPLLLFMVYQLMFAIITPALISGAFVNRVKFKAYMVFLTVWLVLVYFPLVHMVWGGGLFQQMGVLDFGGGIVVHAIAGFSALAFVLFIGKRRSQEEKQHNIPLFTIGAAILWFGWFGFNAGNAFASNEVAVNAFVNTQIGASFAAMTWLLLDIIRGKKPNTIGLFTGALAGLVVTTPTAGYITVQVAMLLGVIVALCAYGAIMFKNSRGWDDTLDVWGVHGIGGFVGVVLLGIFATLSVNSEGANGLFYGGFQFFVNQAIAITVASLYAFLFTYLALRIIDQITGIRVDKETEENGLDIAELGEEAYAE